MKIVEINQQTPAWLQWKKQKLSSTSASILMNMNKYETIESFWNRFVNDIPIEQNEAMKHGNDYEQEAREAFHKHCDIKTIPICGEHSKYKFLISSYDGIEFDERNGFGYSGVEIKSPTTYYMFNYHLKKVPDEYYAQIQHHYSVAESLDKFAFWSWYQGNHVLHMVKIDYSFINEMLDRQFYFYECFKSCQTPAFARFKGVKLKFSELYRNPKLEDEHYCYGDSVFYSAKEYACHVCREKTKWLSVSFQGLPACSSDCLNHEWDNFFKCSNS